MSTYKRSDITNDSNWREDPEGIVHQFGQVITVSLESVKMVKALPQLETGVADGKP
jgi:predicted helicase